MTEALPAVNIERLRALHRTSPEGAIDSVRLFHGRGQCYPGLAFATLDFFQPVLLLTLFAEPPSGWLAEVCAQVAALMPAPAEALVVQRRYLPGASSETLLGQAPEALFARRGPLRFALNPLAQQNIGYFLDMEPGRQWLEALAPGKRVLNLFAYTCAFSVVAVKAGAGQVVNVDMSKRALAQGRDNHHLNGLDKTRSLFLPEQILKSWSRIKKRGPYDIVIFDPPSYQPGSFVATRDYAKLARRVPELLPAGGDILACLNAPELAPDFLQRVFAEECPGAELQGRLPPSPDFPDSNPAQQLKLLHYRYGRAGASESGAG